jgi:serine/threonine protein kinase
MSGTLRTDICERMRFSSGDIVADRYVLREILGTGGYGEVWSAIDVRQERRSVAVKLLRPGSSGTAAQERFLRETQVLALLRQHRHIVELIDSGWHGDQLYMVMEHLSGGSLAHWLRACKEARTLPPLSQVCRWFDQVCRALGAAHLIAEPGPIVHRDINPNNIMLDRLITGEYIVKVVDFGVARLGKRQQTFTGESVGTRGYMSPEQAVGDCDQISPSSDVFALGLLLIEMLTLRVSTSDGTSIASIAMLQKKRLRALLPALRPDVPRPLWAVVEKALQPIVLRRYGDATVLRYELRKAMRAAANAPTLPRQPALRAG